MEYFCTIWVTPLSYCAKFYLRVKPNVNGTNVITFKNFGTFDLYCHSIYRYMVIQLFCSGNLISCFASICYCSNSSEVITLP